MINPVFIAVIIAIIVGLLVFVTFRITKVRRHESAKYEEKNISILPKTTLGKWSVGLTIIFIIAFIVFMFLTEVPTGFSGLPPDFNPVVAFILAMVVVGISVATIVIGLIGMLKHKERSVLVGLGMVITFWFGIVGAVGQYLI